MSFPKAFLEDLKSRFRPSEIVGRTVKLKRQGREYKGLSPFTNEKTPSFTVNDEKGFFHCFSSGEHGDIFSFLMKTQRLSFYESVKQLAEEANVPLPRQTDDDFRQDQQKASLLDVMELAAGFYRNELHRRPGARALSYLTGRGLESQTIDQFGIGYAPAAGATLHDYLAQKSIELELMVKAGLVGQPDDGRSPYDRFRDRIIFPIEDGQGRTIAFGGRTLDPNQSAKYLNSPETPLFHKGSILYNFRQARQACFRSEGSENSGLVVVEGYMDVIALVEAGVQGAVAPLGTALTAIQLELLWRVSPEPILCFDGDSAGIAAAYRVVDRALPLLKPGYSLRLALLPEGQDPDDIVRRGSASSLISILNEARPLSDMVWQRELSVGPLDTPERRAGFEQRLRDILGTIREPRIQAHYKADFRERLGATFRRKPTGSQNRPEFRGKAKPWFSSRRELDTRGIPRNTEISAELRRSALVRSRSSEIQRRESLIVLTMVNHPELLEHHHEGFADVNLLNPKLDRLRNEIIRVAASSGSLDRNGLYDHLSHTELVGVLSQLQGDNLLRQHPFASPEADFSDAERGWNHLLMLHQRTYALQAELDDAESALANETTEENLARFVAVKSELLAMESEPFNFDEGSEQSGLTVVGVTED